MDGSSVCVSVKLKAYCFSTSDLGEIYQNSSNLFQNTLNNNS